MFVLLRIFGEDLNEVRMEVVRLQTLWSSLSLEYSGDRNERLEFHGRDRRNSFSSKGLKKKEMSRIDDSKRSVGGKLVIEQRD